MSQVPTIPGAPSASMTPGSGSISVGPGGISGSFTSPSISVSLDMCNARPIFVYVTQQKGAPPTDTSAWPPVSPPPAGMPAPPTPPPPAPIDRPPSPGAQKGGQIWRVFDPIAPIEKLPVWKEWTEEKEYPNGHWEPQYGEAPKPQEPTEPTPGVCIRTRVFEWDTDQLFKFDEPKRTTPTSQYPNACVGGSSAVAAKLAVAEAELDAPLSRSDGSSVPISQSRFTRKVVLFGHADMCAAFWYNHALSHRRNLTLGMVMSSRMRGALLSTGAGAGFAPCADFNPRGGPNANEQAAEDATTVRTAGGQTLRPGFASTVSAPSGNLTNRRVELFVIPDWATGKPSKINEILTQIHGELAPTLPAAAAASWTPGQFPCPAGTQSGIAEFSPNDPTIREWETAVAAAKNGQPVGEPSAAPYRICHFLSDQPWPDHAGAGQGEGYRQCRFYKRFKQEIENLELRDDECTPGQPGTQPPPSTEPEFTGWKWIPDAPIKVTQGEYHPPRGEHYSYYMDEMVKTGVDAKDLFNTPTVIAPNDRENPDDFNLIRAGQVRVVKMDIGFWGDRRTLDTSRQAGFRRTPDRYFGIIEGQFVFLCYLETPDNAGHARFCSEGFDQDLTPLTFQLDQALRQQNMRILIMAKAVAEDGPSKNRLKVMFPDMHMPRKFDDQDPTYATDECIGRVQRIKSWLLHQMKQDYRLPAASTPWLATIDRELLRDFFEGGAPRLKLPHWYVLNGPKYSNPLKPEGSNIVSQAMDVVKKAQQFLMQVGNRAFVFTQDDYRRMTRKYPDNFPEKGYGRTKDLLFNWFYGSTTDKNAPAPESARDRTVGNVVPVLAQEVLDLHAGTSLQKGSGTAPAQESYDIVDAAPARDMLRFLRVIQQLQRQRVGIDVFQTGDLYELWANRRFLFEDFHETDDPVGQMPEMMQSATKPVSEDNFVGDMFGDEAGKFAAKAGDFVKGLIMDKVKTILGGSNCTDDHNLWWRRETNKAAQDARMDPDQMMLPPEDAYNLDNVRNDFALPRFTSSGPGQIGTAPGSGLRAPTVDFTRLFIANIDQDGNFRPFNASPYRGKTYLRTEANRRIQQVLAFEAPLRTDATGAQEDATLLGNNRTGPNRSMGLWNRAVVDAFRACRATFVYGNHDNYRGSPRDNGLGAALPYYSEPGLWIEHAHRFEDSNIDGQPFGSFLTNLAYEIQELAFGEGLLDEFTMHREQSIFQPGIIQWFLLVQYGGDEFLRRFQRQNENVPRVFPFRIAVNSHTHQPDLVVANIIFKDREVAEVELPFNVPLIGDSISVETLINGGGALMKGVLLWQKFEDWFNAWNERQGFEKWWADLGGNSIDWINDFGGLAKCIDRALAFIQQQGQNALNRLQNEAQQSADSFRRATGL
ncbi:MAG: hypothetical protein IT450_18460 [Phycisphaerales bacterium]|nr:hypothetical protein [Phycisphaerales bacterium]